MNVYYGFDQLPLFSDLTATMGSFDGVHHGHRLLIEHLKSYAAGRDSMVITFEPHPRVVIHPDRVQRLLSTLPEKLVLLAETGVDNVLVIPFTWEFSRLSSEEFIRDYLISKLGVRAMITGQSHFFGRDKGGDVQLLRQYGVRVVDLERFDDISSTQLRDVLERGDMAVAERLLGGGYLVQLPVSVGQHKLLPLAAGGRCDVQLLKRSGSNVDALDILFTLGVSSGDYSLQTVGERLCGVEVSALSVDNVPSIFSEFFASSASEAYSVDSPEFIRIFASSAL